MKEHEPRKNGDKALSVAVIPLFAALTAVGSQLSIPFGAVPVTLQMFFVFLAGYMLKPLDAFISMLLYLVLGAIGMPVFANFSAGFMHLVGPTSGYIWSFPLAAYMISALKSRISFCRSNRPFNCLFAWLAYLGNKYSRFSTGLYRRCSTVYRI